jgi:hypothetical protein
MTPCFVNVSRRLASLVAATGIVLTAAPALPAGGLAYVRATSQLEPEQRGRYHPLHLLDEDVATMWCEGADGLGESEGITIYFKRPQRINRILVAPAPSTGRLVEAVRVSDGSASITVDLGESGVDRTLSRPLSGQTYEITIARVGGPANGALPNDVACLADVVLYLGDLPFGGKLEDKLHYDDRLDKLLGRWQGGPLGAPEKFLVFSLDGTWEWSFKPLMGGRPRKLTGEYRFRGKRLLMREGEVGRWSDVQLKVERVVVDRDDTGAPAGDYDKLVLKGPIEASVLGDYDNAQFD